MAGHTMFLGSVLILGTLALPVYSFIIGAPPDSCGNPTTFHTEPLNDTHVGQYLPQNSTNAPFQVFVSQKFYYNSTNSKVKGHGNITRVTLRAAPGDYFKGFFIQATKPEDQLDQPDRAAYGTFRPVDQNSQPRRCSAAVGQVGGITHTGNLNKTEVSVDWIPPRGCNLGPVQFIATVVRSYSEYWVDIRSDIINPSGFEGRRGLLCRLYVEPYNRVIQAEVLRALRNLERRRGGGGTRG